MWDIQPSYSPFVPSTLLLFYLLLFYRSLPQRIYSVCDVVVISRNPIPSYPQVPHPQPATPNTVAHTTLTYILLYSLHCHVLFTDTFYATYLLQFPLPIPVLLLLLCNYTTWLYLLWPILFPITCQPTHSCPIPVIAYLYSITFYVHYIILPVICTSHFYYLVLSF